MYFILLFSHSFILWFALVTVFATLIRSYYGWFSNKPFTKSDNTLRIVTLSVVHIQVTFRFNSIFYKSDHKIFSQ